MSLRSFICLNVALTCGGLGRGADVVHYQMLYGTTVAYNVGGSTTGFWSARGSFDLRFLDQTADSSRYVVENMQISADPAHQFVGSGELVVPITRNPQILLNLTNVLTPQIGVTFTNVSITTDRRWPMLALRARETTASDAVYTVSIRAAPFQDIWISPATDFRADTFAAPTNIIHSGDLVSLDGRVIKRNHELVVPFAPASSADYGLDALSLSPGGGLAISTHDVAEMRDGDILVPNPPRRIRYTDIFTNAIATSMADPGIDGFQFTSATAFYFSIKRDTGYALNSTTTVQLRDADIWWADLQTHELRLARSREQLFSYPDYQPWLADPQVGIDAFYIWPSGEVWFSLRSSWTAHTAIYSSDGYAVFTDEFVFKNFKPAVNPGLDAFLVITDLAPVLSTPPALKIVISPTALLLNWPETGGAYQLESSATVNGQFQVASPVIPNPSLIAIPDSNTRSRFYRIRQW